MTEQYLKDLSIHIDGMEKDYGKYFQELRKYNKQKLENQNILEAFANYNREIGQEAILKQILKHKGRGRKPI